MVLKPLVLEGKKIKLVLKQGIYVMKLVTQVKLLHDCKEIIAHSEFSLVIILLGNLHYSCRYLLLSYCFWTLLECFASSQITFVI